MRTGSGFGQAHEAIHAHLDHMVVWAACCIVLDIKASGSSQRLRDRRGWGESAHEAAA